MSEPKALWAPWPGPQTRFLQRIERYVLFGGAAGPGKTACLIADPLRQLAIEVGRWERGEIDESVGWAIHFRRVMPDLKPTIARAKRLYPRVFGVPIKDCYREIDHTFRHPCGYQIQFAHMEGDDDYLKYYGAEYTWIGFDEASQFTQKQVDEMDTRLRTADSVLKTMLSMRLATNPVGPGLLWLRQRFVEPAPPETVVRRRIKVSGGRVIEHDQIYIPAKLSDNPSLSDGQYEATLRNKSSAIKRALLDGDWYVSAGAFLAEEWDNEVHVCKPFKIPAGWYRFRSCDYGYSAPASVSWWAVDPDGNMVCYRNLTVRKHTAEALAYRIKELEQDGSKWVGPEWNTDRGCSLLSGPLDSSCWSKTGAMGPTIAETMMRVGINWFPCDKNRHAAADQVRWRLKNRTGHPTVKDEDGKPALIVPGIRWFDTCKAPTRSIPILPADKNDPEVPDTDADDHNYDDTSYACMSRPMKSDRATERVDYFDDLTAMKVRKQRTSRLGYGNLW